MSFHYDEYFKRWYIDLHEEEEPPKRESCCGECDAYRQLGTTACEGCAG